MTAKLPINLDSLLHHRTIESERVEYMAGRAVSRRYRNRRIGEFLKELDLTEVRSTGIPRILRVMQAHGSPQPHFESDDECSSFLIRLPVHEGFAEEVAGEVTEQVMRLLAALEASSLGTKDLLATFNLSHRPTFIQNYLQPALEAGWVEMTQPESPCSPTQKYRLTNKGKAWLKGRRV